MRVVIFTLCASLFLGACRRSSTEQRGPSPSPSAQLPAPDKSRPGNGAAPAGGQKGQPSATPEPSPSANAVTFDLTSRLPNDSCLARPPPAGSSGAALKRVFPRLTFNAPLAMRTGRAADDPPGSTRWFVAERQGVIRSFLASADPDPASVLTIADMSARVSTDGEGGLLGLAVDPDFATNGNLYASYTVPIGSGTCANQPDDGATMCSRVSRLHFSAARGTLSLTNEDELIQFRQTTATNHKGGNLLFGPAPNYHLFVAFGDGGGGNDTFDNGQRPGVFFSKMLRIDVRSAPASGKKYAIPEDNPNIAGLPEIYAQGFRNPFRFSFDRLTGELWVGDVGQDTWEEVNKVSKGGNYGWPHYEAAHCRGELTRDLSLCDPPLAEAQFPVAEYRTDTSADFSGTAPSGRHSITGGYVYRGQALPAYAGTYIVADSSSQEIRLFAPPFASGTRDITDAPQLTSPGGGLAAMTEDDAGELYFLGLYSGKIYRLEPDGAANGGSGSDFPQLLSQTGCFDPSHPEQPARGLVPYGVNSPLWSDGADKRRWMAIPDGTQVTVEANGHFSFPPGSVLVKEFSLAGKRLETRLFMHPTDSDWQGYTYVWNEAQTDATLADGAVTTLVAGTPWTTPTRGQCLGCHTTVAGIALGPDLGQLNGRFAYPSGTSAEQLKTLEHIGYFTAPLPSVLPKLANPAIMDESLNERARAYLHANCSHCHQPGGPTPATLDLRVTTRLSAMGVCNVTPSRGDLGLTDAKIVAPGAPERSVLVRRLNDVAYRMPPFGSQKIDAAGAALLTAWVSALAACPTP